jgi:hypothetical protein
MAVWGPDSDSSGFSRNDGTTGEFSPVLVQDDPDHLSLFSRGETCYPKDARVRHSTNYGQFAEVLVERDKNPALCVSSRQDLLITRI